MKNGASTHSTYTNISTSSRSLRGGEKKSALQLTGTNNTNQSDWTYLAISQWEVAGASQCRKGTLCSLMWMSYKP